VAANGRAEGHVKAEAARENALQEPSAASAAEGAQ